MKKKIKVVILESHPLINTALEIIFDKEPCIELMGMYSDDLSLLSGDILKEADVLILDYSLNNERNDGFYLIRKIRKNYPNLKLLVFSDIESILIVQKALSLGVRGYVGKRKGHKTLLEAIIEISMDKIFLTENLKYEIAIFRESHRDMLPFITRQDVNNINMMALKDLTTREVEVLHCMLEGKSVTEISEKFSRSCKTVSGHKQNALRKLGIKSDMELFLYRKQIMNLYGSCMQ